MTEWARMSRRRVIVRDTAGTEIVIHPGRDDRHPFCHPSQ